MMAFINVFFLVAGCWLLVVAVEYILSEQDI